MDDFDYDDGGYWEDDLEVFNQNEADDYRYDLCEDDGWEDE